LSKAPDEHEFPVEAQRGTPKLLSNTAFWGPFPIDIVGGIVTGVAVGNVVVGELEGEDVTALGTLFGLELGIFVGLTLGEIVGDEIGDTVWLELGEFDGLALGGWLGDALGEVVGKFVGFLVGVLVGVFVGAIVGKGVGAGLAPPLFTEYSTLPPHPNNELEYIDPNSELSKETRVGLINKFSSAARGVVLSPEAVNLSVEVM
jgi:hypothetical protein